MSCSACPVLPILFCLSCFVSPVLSVLVLPVLFCLLCSGFHVSSPCCIYLDAQARKKTGSAKVPARKQRSAKNYERGGAKV
jgi:uncharacterized membrane protein YvlD (DUF360 family)